MKKFLVLSICLVFCVSGLVFAGGEVGSKAPDVNVIKWVTPNAPDVSSMKGNVRIIEFWATWCGSCVKNIPHLNEIYRKYQPEGVELISLSSDKSYNTLSKFVKLKGIEYHVGMDNGSVDAYGIRAYPTMVVVDSRGIVVWRGYPWSSGLDAALRKAIKRRGPATIIDGIELGPFKYLEANLKGGANFEKAYRQLENASNDNGSSKKTFAARILSSINSKIASKIDFAKKIEKKDPVIAKKIFGEVVTKYGKVEVSKPAYSELNKIKNADKK